MGLGFGTENAALAFLVTFIIVLIILRKFAWGPLLSAVEGREKNITNAIESAKRERAEAEKLLSEQKTAIASARQEAAEAVRKTQADMEKRLADTTLDRKDWYLSLKKL